MAASVIDPATLERGQRPLRALADNYPKTLITLDAIPRTASHEGIRQVNALDWLLEA